MSFTGWFSLISFSDALRAAQPPMSEQQKTMDNSFAQTHRALGRQEAFNVETVRLEILRSNFTEVEQR